MDLSPGCYDNWQESHLEQFVRRKRTGDGKSRVRPGRASVRLGASLQAGGREQVANTVGQLGPELTCM